MGKKNLTPAEICRISNEYLQALRLAKGQRVVDLTDLTCRKGFFYLRSPGHSKEAPGIPYRPHQIEALTADLCKEIPKRTDSDDDGTPD